MTNQNTDARVIELHEKQKAVRASLKRTVPKGKKARARLIEIAATASLRSDEQKRRGA
jgi:hypothetical protein